MSLSNPVLPKSAFSGVYSDHIDRKEREIDRVERYFIVERRGIERRKGVFVASYGADKSNIEFHDATARFWDVVGDAIMSVIWQNMKSGRRLPQKTVYLLPDRAGYDGYFYSKQTVYNLSEKAMFRLVMVADKNENFICHPYHGLERKDRHMKEKMILPSLSDYRKQLERRKNGSLASAEIASEQTEQQLSISPFSNSKPAKISGSSRENALRFAHPVDQTIISVLDNPVVNTAFHKVVQAGIDAKYGLALARGIHISPNTYGDLYDIVVDCANKLGIPIPYVIISDTVQGINACTAGTDQFAFIAISSFLPIVMNREELAFVIGHECGHLALGHVVYHTALNVIGSAGGLLPLVGAVVEKTILNAWNRRSEISADRAGLICCGDIQVAKRCLFKLEAGLLKTDGVDIDGYVREAEQVLDNTSLGRFSEITSSHPIIPKRIKALDYFSKSQLYDSITGKGAAWGGRLLTDSELISKTEQIIEIKLGLA